MSYFQLHSIPYNKKIDHLINFETTDSKINQPVINKTLVSYLSNIKTEIDNQQDDWDFLLYEYKKNFCKRIEDNMAKPIRSNLSRSPITGISRQGKENFVAAGVNNNYSRPIHVHEGERYVLVVNNPKRSGGKHTLILHYPKKTLQIIMECILI